MRQILMTVLLIATVVVLYQTAVRGEEGIMAYLQDAGVAMAQAISRISP